MRRSRNPSPKRAAALGLEAKDQTAFVTHTNDTLHSYIHGDFKAMIAPNGESGAVKSLGRD